jgi:hypothetical protein
MGGGSSSGSSPLDGQPERQGRKERTPEMGQEPGPEQKDQDSQARNGQPQSPRESDDPSANNPSGPPPGSETSRVDPSRGNERWGDLPVHVRDLFRTEGGGAMPPQYRDWIDSYYRRLNRRP